MADWPSTLPSPLADSIEWKPHNNQIRTQMDAGLAKVRRRFTAVGADATFRVLLTRAQVETLETFVTTTLKDVLPFNWKDWRLPTPPVAAYRFRSRPSYAPAGRPDLWIATLDLEKLP